MPLRSNFEPGTSRWATRRAQWRALGLTDEDMVKPKIAIVNSSFQLAICFSHLDEIARRARRAVQLAGGVAFEVRTAAPSDFITSAGHRGGYILSARDLITNDIEVAVEGRRAARASPMSPGSAGTPALAVRGLSVAYGAMVAVHDATFSIDPGEACAITGPNGNGKSSLLMGISQVLAAMETIGPDGAVTLYDAAK